MGRASRQKPDLLAEKLTQIRNALGLSQNGMLIRLKLQDSNIKRNSISGYERGEREPSLLVLYAYANVANVFMEVLVDDELELPDIIPSQEKSLGKKMRK